MNHGTSDILLSQLSNFVVDKMGLYFPENRWCDLVRAINNAVSEFGFNDVESCIQWLVSSPITKNQIEILASCLTVGETYFYRDIQSFEILESHILPELINSRQTVHKHLRVWSVGCSTGEEPYSIAILLSKVIADLKNWSITVLATDINPHSIRKALVGVYKEWSFRDTPMWVKEKYFTKTNEGFYEIIPQVKEMVRFSYLNLVEDSYPSFINNTNAMDIIFCRNVLMYFSEKQKRQVIQKLYNSLMDGGWLIVSSSETSQVYFSEFVTVTFPGVTLYKKDSQLSHHAKDFRIETPYIISQIKANSNPEVSLPVQTDILPETQKLTMNTKQTQKSPETLYDEALAFYNDGDYANAEKQLVILYSSKSEPDEKVLALLIRAFVNQGKLDEASEWCVKAIAKDKLNPSIYYLHAIILEEQGKTDEAVISLKKTIYLDQKYVLAHFLLGNITIHKGKLKESDKHYENALSILQNYQQGDVLPESDGLTAGRLSEIIAKIKEG
jgi:chemotaxis protein methyltransferase CheR